MGKRYTELNEQHIQFIHRQPLFFVGTAGEDTSVNISPKGMDSLRVITPGRILWLNVTGSGNETAAHVLQNPRMTLMFCAFEGRPKIVRVYGQARLVYRGDAEYPELAALLPELPGARQIFDLSVERVQTSCGMAVPRMTYEGPRTQLNDWAAGKGDSGIRQYWSDKNRRSIDGADTGLSEYLDD